MKSNSMKSVFCAVFFCVLIVSAAGSALSQTTQLKPELSVAGFRLGDEESAKTVLRNYSRATTTSKISRNTFFTTAMEIKCCA